MEIIIYQPSLDIDALLARPVVDHTVLYETVEQVLSDIRLQKDQAVRYYSQKFDHTTADSLQVTQEELAQAADKLDPLLKEAIEVAYHNIEKFHTSQKFMTSKVETTPGVFCWQKTVPIEKVGLYIPGGTAPLFSTVLMLGIPAKIAGCQEIVLCSPPDKEGHIHPAILYAAHKVGITSVFKLGGIQAIGAMAYGTETVPMVYKIFGPGNRYVMAAKQIVARDHTAIDMPAGPSEVAIIADSTAYPSFIAADLLSQAEHGIDSQTILFTDSLTLAQRVSQEVELQLDRLPRKEIARQAITHSKLIVVENLSTALNLSNDYAPEHLILQTQEAEFWAEKVINAGSVFIGHYTPESAGDYASGTNHTLPTHGFAKSYSGVNLDSFYRKITFQHISKEGLQKIGPHIEIMAAEEELDAHKNAVTIRLNS